jgi:signal transduction histidine kinase
MPAVHDLDTLIACVESNPAPTLLIDEDGTVLAINRAGATLLELDPSVRPLSIEQLLASLGAVDDDRFQGEFAYTTTSGNVIPLLLHVSRPRREDGRDSYLVTIEDRSEVHALREERDRLLRLATVGQVMPMVLHELKNPLATISTSVELMIEEEIATPLRAELHAILTEIRRMTVGMEGLGAVGRGLAAERHAAIDLALRDAARVLTRKAELAGISLTSDVPDLPLFRLDPNGVRAIVFNLLNNAIHACQAEDTITLSARFDRDAEVVYITVLDSGSGMSKDVLSRCTDMFYSTKPTGSGIGLSLCGELTREVGGRLDIRSRPGTGTEVTVTLPVTPGTRTPRP